MTLSHDVAGDGPVLVLLHSGVCDRRMWDAQWPALIDAGQIPGTAGSDQAEPAAARKRIAELEARPNSSPRPAGSSADANVSRTSSAAASAAPPSAASWTRTP